jgi:hypothetical protein
LIKIESAHPTTDIATRPSGVTRQIFRRVSALLCNAGFALRNRRKLTKIGNSDAKTSKENVRLIIVYDALTAPLPSL